MSIKNKSFKQPKKLSFPSKVS